MSHMQWWLAMALTTFSHWDSKLHRHGVVALLGTYLHFTLTFFPSRSFKMTSIIVYRTTFLGSPQPSSSQGRENSELHWGLAQAL